MNARAGGVKSESNAVDEPSCAKICVKKNPSAPELLDKERVTSITIYTYIANVESGL